MTNSDALGANTQSVDELALREIVAAASETQNDPEAFLGLHTADTIIVNIAGRRVLGRDELGVAMRAALASPLSDVRTSVEILDIRYPATDVAIVSCVKTVHDERPESGHDSLPAAGALSYTMTRTAEGWRIAHAQTTPIL